MSVATASRPTQKPYLVAAALVISLGALILGPVGCGSGEERSNETAAEEAGGAPKRLQLNMGVDDRTTEIPPSDEFAIQVPGEELWTPDLEYGGTGRLFGEYPVGEEYEFYLYPEGKEGPRQRVPFSMKPDMSSGLASSKTYVRIYDDRIVVDGPAVPDGKMTLDRPASDENP